jgi:hypothetical protein
MGRAGCHNSQSLWPLYKAALISQSNSYAPAHAVPEWQMRQVQSEIDRYQDIIRAGEVLRDTRTKD